MENQSLDERAISLVHAECLNATANGYLEPYYEMKRAAISLAIQLIELREGLGGLEKSHESGMD